MPSELWEIVRADELKVGDVATYGSPDEYESFPVESIKPCEDDEDELEVGIGPRLSIDLMKEEKVFRRHTGHHPDVLMRVIQSMHSEIRGWNEVGDYPSPTDSIDKYIAESEAEIAKERESNE